MISLIQTMKLFYLLSHFLFDKYLDNAIKNRSILGNKYVEAKKCKVDISS